MPFWVDNTKKVTDTTQLERMEIDRSLFSEKQYIIYDTVRRHYTGGASKHFFIDSLKSLPGCICIVTSNFCIAAFNVDGLLHLPTNIIVI